MSRLANKSDVAKFQSAKRIFGDALTIQNVFIFLSAAFIFAWLPDGLWALVEESLKSKKADYTAGLWQSGIATLLLVGIILWFRQKFRSLETTIKPNKVTNHPQENLILFLSLLMNEQALSKAQEAETFKELGDGHSWQMAFRAIEHHKAQLLHLYVIPSIDSAVHYELFARLVNNTYPNITIHQLSPIDFENIDAVYEEVDRAYRLIKERGYKEKDIVLDITGGQKVTSIIGAIFSLGFDRRFQYVSTKDKKVLAFDLDYVFKE